MSRRLVLSGVAAMAALLAPGASATDEIAPGRVIKDTVYRTVGDRPLRLDLYVHPAVRKKPGPVLIHFHGGGWARGARPESWTGFRPYIAAGFSVVTVEYRLADAARAPAAVEDARCALHWVDANAERYGFDRARIVVAGTSAGAHLALMAGLLPDENVIDPAECRGAGRAAAVVDLYGPTDLTATKDASGARHATVANWIGEGDGADRMARRMSPIAWLRSDVPPVFIGHGDADPVVPVAQSIDLKRRLDELAVPADLFIVPGGGHGKFDADSQRMMTARALAFLCGRRIPDPRACAEKN
ncbi:alpha/beta hydrolase fold domain-containing protein [Sphingopyxis terrae]|uniref:alpha/beta hydrolase fold domain-containing protein n=1 Tax=Sphingopyxis terrae TaxID=33052 RepID=UPI003F7E24D8